MILTALTTVLAPLSLLVLPGIAFLPRWRHEGTLALWIRIALTSVISTILLSLGAASIGLPQLVVAGFLVLVSGASLARQYQQLRSITNWYALMTPVLIFLLLLLAFAVPFIVVHDGLPSGDIQKSLIWASDILESHELPNYQRAIADYNRDPVDFYTPGLHTLLAYTLSLNNSPGTAGFFAITMALAVVGVGLALARQLFPSLPAWSLLGATALLILTNIRWLRYIREPGYHVQNSVGEVLVFGLIFLLVGLLRTWSWRNAVGVAGTMLALAFTHQFSAFMAAFMMVPFFIAVVGRYIHRSSHWRQLLLPAASVGIIFIIGWSVGLLQKIPHIFSATPHLAAFIPSVPTYFSLMGVVWLALGLGGLLLIIMSSKVTPEMRLPLLAFVALSVIVLGLSQGPRFFVDIPPVRALFYAVIPLSIAGGYFVSATLRLWQQTTIRRLVAVLLLVIVATSTYTSLARAFELSHTLRTNSTFLSEQQYLVEQLQKDEAEGGLVVDDYNRRSASWLILTGRPTYTRIAADLAVQMAEAQQSPLRYDLYLNQLDYEKIFSLGSHPAIAELMAHHKIAFVTGITESSHSAFAHNPALQETARGGDIIVYKLRPPTRTSSAAACTSTTVSDPTWLLRTSTLVNDLGDREDTFEHLPASVRATQLSEPQTRSYCTWRSTTSAFIPLQFNVGDYVSALWNKEYLHHPDRDVELLVTFQTALSEPLQIQTSADTVYTLPSTQDRLRLPAQEVKLDERGFITLTLLNPSQQLVSIDLIALGLAQVP